MLSLVLFYHN